MALKSKERIKIPPDTTINLGDHEDSEFFTVINKKGCGQFARAHRKLDQN